MRFDLDRQRGDNPAPPPPVDDKRGRHTKFDLRERRRLVLEAYDRRIHPPRDCGCDPYDHGTNYDNGYEVCTGCGVVMAGQLLRPDFAERAGDGTGNVRPAGHDPRLWGLAICAPRSAPYKRVNHLAELLKESTDTDPRVPDDDFELIEEHSFQYYLANKHINPVDYSADCIKRFIRPLGPRKMKKYGERWLQIKRRIVGQNYYDDYGPELMGVGDAIRIHQRYMVFADMFEQLKGEGHPLFKGRKNIPHLNTCVLHLMQQDSEQSVERYGWYFTMLETIAARLITETRIGVIIVRLSRLKPNLAGGFLWRYKCMLPANDRAYFRKHPDRFSVLLKQQIQLCRKPPKRSRPSENNPLYSPPISDSPLP